MGEIVCPLSRAAHRFPNEAALIEGERVIGYGEYNARVTAVASRLHEDGIRPGQRVGICARNSIEYAIALMAIIRTGAIVCPISFRFPTAMIESIAGRLKLKKLLVDPEIVAEPSRFGKLPIDLASVVDLKKQVAAEIEDRTVSLSRYSHATIVQTSGSSGDPKAALHCYANHYFSALGSNENIRLVPGDRWLLTLPLFHVGGIGVLFRCVLAGAAAVIAKNGEGWPDVADREKVTHCSFVPTQMKRLLDDPSWTKSLARAKAVLIGGAAVHDSLLEAAYDAHWPLFTTYGMTETSSQLTTSEPGAKLERLYTSGRLLPYRQIRISKEREILVGGETLFVGYVEDDRIDSAVDDDGWFHTGDVGEVDTLGYLTVLGRRDNMFLSGGENIQPEGIERALRRLPDVEDALVVPVSDDEYGARPFAFLKLGSFRQFESMTSPGESLPACEATVRALCRSGDFRTALSTELPRYMIPVMCAPWPPETAGEGLKPARARFQELAEQLYNRQP